MAKRQKYVKPKDRAILPLQVAGSKQIGRNIIRVTLGGEALTRFTSMGFDQWFRLFLPNGDHPLRLPTSASSLGWFAQYLLMSKETRPLVRNYTVREFRGTELDVDFVVHDDTSPAATWATSAAVGDEVAILDEGITYQPSGTEDRVLLVGDESALPAIAGILASSPRELVADVVLEIPHADDKQDLDAPEGVNVEWLVRTDPAAVPGALALSKITSAPPAAGTGYAWVAGEQALAAGVRRHLVANGVDKHDITFTGYWRIGKSAGQF